VVRVLRITRLFPYLSRLSLQKGKIITSVFSKRLWRVFQILDSDRIGLISVFDIRCFYFTLLEQCPQIARELQPTVFLQDMTTLCSDRVANVYTKRITVNHFRDIILNTVAGNILKKSCWQTIQQQEGTCSLTRSISNSLAMKVSVALLAFTMILSLTDPTSDDRSVSQLLALLDNIASTEHANIQTNGIQICSMVDKYAPEFSFLSLQLDWRTYIDHGPCGHSHNANPDRHVNPCDRVKELLQESWVREDYFRTVCVTSQGTSSECCAMPTRSWVVQERRSQVIDDAWASMAYTFIMIGALLCCTKLVHMEMEGINGGLVGPIRLLVDDLNAMTALELAATQPEVDGHGQSLFETDSLKQLQCATRSLQGAIRSWSRFVPPAVVQRLLSNQVEAAVGVSKVHATILFCDIKDFSNLIADSSPSQLLEVLHAVLGTVSDVVSEFDGTLLEFIGEEILAVFNAPVQIKNHIKKAVACGLAVHNVVAALPCVVDLAKSGIYLQLRCAVHTAMVLVGNIGSDKRLKYGVLGDGVNLTARLKGLNSHYGTHTLISDTVFNEPWMGSKFVTRAIDKVAVKGRCEPTVLYEVLGEVSETTGVLARGASLHAIGFQNFLSRHFTEALELFHRAIAVFDSIGVSSAPSKNLAQRSEAFIKQPPPANWDGVQRLNKK